MRIYKWTYKKTHLMTTCNEFITNAKEGTTNRWHGNQILQPQEVANSETSAFWNLPMRNER